MRSFWLIAVAFVAAPTGHQALAEYNFTPIVDPSATLGTSANGINDAGDVVGSYTDATGQHGFLDSGMIFTNFNVPGATATSANGISGTGTIIGAYTDSLGASHGFTGSGSYTAFDATFPGAVGATFGNGINDTGTVTAGYFFDTSSVSHGFLNNGVYTQIDAPSATSTVTNGVNNAGTSVGYYTDATGTHGFVRSAGGAFTTVNDPNAANGTFLTGINDLGEISGYYVDASNNTVGFLLEGSNFLNVVDPDSPTFTQINGINDLGTLVGNGIDAGLLEGFVATVPEPATLSVLSFGALSLLMRRRRRLV